MRAIPYRKHEVSRGDDLAWLLVVNDTDPETGDAARRDLTDHTITLTAKTSPQDPDPGTAQLTSPGNGIDISAQTGTTLGEALVTLPGEATDNFPDDLVFLHYDIQLLTPTDQRVTIERGQIMVRPDITLA